MCGADKSGFDRESVIPGSPPRVRSRPNQCPKARKYPGITSACAEQTIGPSAVQSRYWDHLRVCGADLLVSLLKTPCWGSPPRVRSRLDADVEPCFHGGITSACAEQTGGLRYIDDLHWDHLRVCGADVTGVESDGAWDGSPPRVRSRRPCSSRTLRRTGITSACAEQTSSTIVCMSIAGDHLRVCGADATLSTTNFRKVGSPPRVRSRHTRRS